MSYFTTIDSITKPVTITNSASSAIVVDLSRSYDAFGRVRVSEPYTLFDSKHLYDKNTLFFSEALSGNATSVHTVPDATVVMAVSTVGDYVIRQSRMRFNYQPGKSQLSFMTFTSGNYESNIIKRVGLFYSTSAVPYSVLDGIYFESNGQTNSYSFNIAKSAGTHAGTQTAVQSAWSIDPLNGSGSSGITLDFTKNQILLIDYEWLGLGTVRYGFVVNGTVYYAHAFAHSGDSDALTSTYMSTPNLPVRYEIRKVGSPASKGQLGHVCSTVMSEGGFNPNGVVRSIDRGSTAITSPNNTNIFPILSIRLKPTALDSTILIESLDISIPANIAAGEGYGYMLILNPSLGTDNASWVDIDNSSLQYDVSRTNANTITLATSSVALDSGYMTSTSKTITINPGNAIKLGCSLQGVRDEIVLAGRRAAGTATQPFLAALQIREL